MDGKNPAETPAKPGGDDAARLMATQAPSSPPRDLQSTQPQVGASTDTVLGGAVPKSPGETLPPPAASGAPGARQAEASAAGASAAPKVKKLDKLGDYKLIKKLGAGGMGEVYKGHQISLDRDVAIKVLFKHLAANTDFVERFQREARIMAKLDHPNILRCYGVGQEGGFHYFAMEFVDGGSMQDVLDKRGKLSVGDALHVILACARALQHAHELNMIHRDIKPDNILITQKGVVKVADLGLAKAHGENVSLTRTGTGAGTPIYMSPEQARDAKHVDHRSDIYSLGCMLYTFLAGKPPFAGETYVELFEAKEKGRFEPVRKSNIEIPERLDLIIDKTLAKKVEHRYQSCAELTKDLEGLGLANSALSFLETKPAAPAAATPTSAPKATPKPATPAAATASKPLTSKAQAEAATGKNIFYLSYRTSEGKVVRRKLTTDQIRELIRDPDFDLTAQASREPKEGYRSLATFPEFESALRGRLEKARADRKTVKFKEMYKKLEKEEISRKRWKWLRELFRSTTGWILFLIYLALIGGAIVGLYFGGKYLWDIFGGKFLK
jgi:serine/threonine-protein kinase